MAIWSDLIPSKDMANFEKGGMGGRIGYGKKPAVLVVDMTRAFVEDAFPLGCSATGVPCARAIRRLLEVAREEEVPVLYTAGYVWELPMEHGRWKDHRESQRLGNVPEAHEIFKELAPLPGEKVILKSKPSGFFGTELTSYLVYLNVDTVIVTGMVTSGCVRATVVDAFSFNYRVIVPEECVADRGEISHKVGLFDMHMKYADVLPVGEVLTYLRSLRVAIPV